MVKKIVVELDVSELDEEITLEQLREIHVVYYNIGEDHEWEEAVPYRIIKTEE